MIIRKGPYGSFAVYKKTDSDVISDYALEMTRSQDDLLLECYDDMDPGKSELYYDCSGLISVDSYSGSSDDLTLRRKNAGDLFLMISNICDHLISPAVLVLDPMFIFTDETGNMIRICLIPVERSPDDLDIAKIDTNRLEELLNIPFFSEILTEDEKQKILFSISTSDEETLENIALSLKENDDKKNKRSDLNTDLIYSCIFTSLSMLFLAIRYYPALFVSVFSALIFLIRSLKDNKRSFREMLITIKSKNNSVNDKQTTDDDHETRHKDNNISRKDILFADLPKENRHFKVLVLESLKEVGGAFIRKAIYTNEATLGSDQFLSDILIDDPSVEYLHARIFLKDDDYYLEDLSRSGRTYIEDEQVKRISNDPIEIKYGQKLRIGDIEFRLRN